ncbi:hypothetical protein KXD93_01290 [Mucilaginibacter sp. BJC16-A38]|uniref:hypothetical protein n=1 Tax=Mucilaginibacter phenanthrenivorans TaxID=1234842 RepID=UPI002158963E|nr:hypothetical protein [Mucilaginibacter phenanthrenivorans]MCR8556254.1 hypothetical protein [Mucilaginibacter phenanthrenivorans]
MYLFKYKAALTLLILCICSFANVIAQQKGVSFTSSDKDLERAFNWAREMALHYKGKAGDPVGPWYESALPPRDAFCMRDVSHQCIGAEILGLSRENNNMFNLFVSNISASKNWCSYWEINKYSKPAPEDYRNDKEFWYNLPANFDLLYATHRLYLWTGDKHYISDPAYVRFQQKSVGEYIDSWVLSADSLLKRPAHPNAPVPYNEGDSFHRCRGLPSYSEGVANLKTGVDLVAALYRGLLTYSEILSEKGRKKEAALYAKKAEQYRQRLEADWWDEKEARYYSYLSNDGKFGKEEGEPFLLWFDALKDSTRIRKTIAHIASKNWNMENTSYLPLVFYKNGYWDKAREYILYLSDPATARREYPEVSFGVIEGIVQGLMGITPDAPGATISTIYKSNGTGNAVINQLPLLHTTIDLAHISKQQSVIKNTGQQPFKWKAMFYGAYKRAYLNGNLLPLKKGTDQQQREISIVETTVKPGEKADIKVVY